MNVNLSNNFLCVLQTAVLRTNSKAANNSTEPKGGVSCSKDRFVVTGTFVLLFNICGESPALRVVAKRYMPFYTTEIKTLN
jgi:hypothetical protein